MESMVGFRFRPTDEELLNHYLRVKNEGGNTHQLDRVINTVDFCNFEPGYLPGQSKIKSSDKTWYFFRVKKNKYNTGDKQNRSTSKGFWKVTGKPMEIMGKTRDKIGSKRVLVFRLRNPPPGSKTEWIIHEYNTLDQEKKFTICKVKFKGVGNPGNQDERNESLPINPMENNDKEIDKSSNPTNEVESNGDGLAGPEDMKLDNESYQEPFNNPPNPNKDFSDDIQRLLFDEKTNNFFDNGLYEQASNVPMNMFGDIEGLPHQEEIDMSSNHVEHSEAFNNPPFPPMNTYDGPMENIHGLAYLQDMFGNASYQEAFNNVPFSPMNTYDDFTISHSLRFHLEETNHALHKAPIYEPKGSLDNEVFYMQEDRNDYKPQNPLTGVCSVHSSDDDKL